MSDFYRAAKCCLTCDCRTIDPEKRFKKSNHVVCSRDGFCHNELTVCEAFRETTNAHVLTGANVRAKPFLMTYPKNSYEMVFDRRSPSKDLRGQNHG